MTKLRLRNWPPSSLPLENKRHELFCCLYATEQGCFGNATKAYKAAYGIDSENKSAVKSARVCASNLLKDAIILRRISFLLEIGYSNFNVERHLAFLITQSADLKNKIIAINKRNLLSGHIRKRVTLGVTHLSDEELDKQLLEIEKEIIQVQMVG